MLKVVGRGREERRLKLRPPIRRPVFPMLRHGQVKSPQCLFSTRAMSCQRPPLLDKAQSRYRCGCWLLGLHGALGPHPGFLFRAGRSSDSLILHAHETRCIVGASLLKAQEWLNLGFNIFLDSWVCHELTIFPRQKSTASPKEGRERELTPSRAGKLRLDG
jgi:hypothetical protein